MSEDRQDSDRIAKSGRRLPSTAFKPGTPKPPNSGRKKGQRNRMTVALKDAIIAAAEHAGHKHFDEKTKKHARRGPNGLQGYVNYLALHNEQVYGALLLRVLPLHVNAVVQNQRYKTEEEIRALCVERGVPYDVVSRDAGEPVAGELIDVTPDRET